MGAISHARAAGDFDKALTLCHSLAAAHPGDLEARRFCAEMERAIRDGYNRSP
jgi:hypothetical protein